MTSTATNRTHDESNKEHPEVAAKKKPIVVVAVVTAVVLGGAVGGLVIGPRLVGAVTGQENEAVAESAHEAPDEITGKFFQLENLIVNPAGSRGERFLMVSVAFEVPDDEALTELHEREILVRDAVSAALSERTLENLSELGARESIKAELSELVAPFVGSAAWVRVYLPRFVIQ